MASKVSAGDMIGISGEVTRVNDDGSVTLRLNGYDYPGHDAPRISHPDRKAASRARPAQAALESARLAQYRANTSGECYSRSAKRAQ